MGGSLTHTEFVLKTTVSGIWRNDFGCETRAAVALPLKDCALTGTRRAPLKIDVRNNAIFHAGPIIRPLENDKFEMVSVGPTTSMRMDKFEYEFVKETGVRVIIGKGGMKENTERACKEFGAIHCVFPAGNAVVAATEVEEIVAAEWRDLGMPETLWNCRVKEFGPLIVSIDTKGNNLFEKNKIEFNKRKDEQIEKISKQVGFIK